MSNVGDLVFNEYDQEGRLAADGSSYPTVTYPALAEIGLPIPDLGLDFNQSSITGIEYPRGAATSVAVSPDGRWLAAVSPTAPEIRVIDTLDWSSVPITASFVTANSISNGGGNTIDFSPDGKYLAIGGNDNTNPDFIVLSVGDWQEVETSFTASDSIQAVRFSTDSQRLAIGQLGSPYVTVLDTDNWDIEAEITQVGANVFSLAWSPDGSGLAVGRSTFVRIYSTSDWSLIDSFSAGTAYDLDYSPDGQYLAGARVGSPYIYVVRLSDGESVPVPALNSVRYSLRFSSNSEYLVAAGSASSEPVSVFHTADWSLLSSTPAIGGNTYSVAVWPDNNYIAFGCPTARGGLLVYPLKKQPPVGYFYVPNIPVNPENPSLPVLIQAEPDENGVPEPDVGDILFNELDTTGRLVADGSHFSMDAWPELAEVIGEEVLKELDLSVVSGTPSILGTGYDVFADASYVYIASLVGSRFTVVNKSDWSVVSGTPALPGIGRGVFADASYVYLAHDGGDYFTVVNKSDWTVVSGTPALPGNGLDVFADDNYVYLAHANGNRFTILNKSDWSVVSGTPALPGSSEDAFADDNYVYLAHAGGRRFTVIDKTDWSVISGTPTLPSTGYDVFADDNYVYLAHIGGNYFTIINKSDWSVVSGTPSLPGTGRGVFADDKYVYLAHTGAPFFTTINKSDWSVVPGTPLISNTGYGVYADDSFVYVAHQGSNNFTVLNKYTLTPLGYFTLPNIPDNPHHPELPVLVQAEKVE